MNWLANRLASSADLLVLRGAYDPLSARLIAASGSEAIYCGGFAATAAQHALPDLGLLGLEDMVSIYARISASCPDLPLIVDGDAGHGGLLNVARMVDQFAKIGVDALHVEDQVSPKRCGHLAGKAVVDRQEALARVRTAVRNAEGKGIDIIARTDAIAVHGFDEAILRANAFLDEGAAAVFIDAPQTQDQIAAIPNRVQGPVLFNAAPTGGPIPPSDHDLAQLGYAIALHPIEALLAASSAVAGHTVGFAEINEILGTRDFLERELALSRD